MSLAKVNTVKSRQNYTCEKCQVPIEKGQMYRWFKVGFRSRYKHVRCMTPSCTPRNSELESSKLADVYGALEDAEFHISMAYSIEDLQAALEECASQINDVASEYSDAAESMGEAGYENQEKADMLEQAADELASTEFEETTMVECDECNGSGTEECYECDGSGMLDEDEECDACGASGEIGDCPECGGTGEVEGEPDIEEAREIAQAAIDDFDMP